MKQLSEYNQSKNMKMYYLKSGLSIFAEAILKKIIYRGITSPNVEHNITLD